VSELALAVFASETGTHLIRPPQNRRWASHLRAFDGGAYEAGLAARGFRFLGRSGPGFPPLLGAIHDPPPGLFLRGGADPGLLSQPAVAIVGARACSGYGASVARSLGRELARAGLVVVSGLARGVDAEAHRGALEAGAATVAVLGCGIDRDYPAAHAELARRIVATGLLVSEYAPGANRRRGGSPPATGSSPASAPPPSSSRRASEAARSSPPTSHSRRAERSSSCRGRSAPLSPRARTRS
jgi:DNA processing protein